MADELAAARQSKDALPAKPTNPLDLTPEQRAALIAAFSETGRKLREAMEVVVRQLAAQIRPVLDWMVTFDTQLREAGVYGITEADHDSPEWGDVCAHVCGQEPDHECDARATGTIEHQNLAGGVTTMPVCGPCRAAETAALEAASA
jgi:hypothetical protein